ncbi:MAG TPA: glucokinase [Longimicrobiales bacterium]|nr:glucokinase [Longimicrobiales bacterium]
MTSHRSPASRAKRHGAAPARIVGDIGGTHARFAVLGAAGCLEHLEVLDCADYPRVEDAIVAYLAEVGLQEVSELCLAVAGPVDRDQVDLPNNRWAFSRHQLELTLGAPLLVINDFTAQALSLDLLAEDEFHWLGSPRPAGACIRGVVGPGTGLGVAILMPSGEVLPSEGGHVGFAPTNNHQIDLLRALHSRFRRVSVERLASGPGLENLYWANRHLETGEREGAGLRRSAREVAELAAQGDPVAMRSVADFFDVLATFAGDLALMAWAAGGVYLSGGVLRRLMPFFDPERFRARFEDKGRFTHFLETVPLAWIRAEHPGLLGCAAALTGRTGALSTGGGTAAGVP